MPRPQEDIIALSRRSTDERRGRQSLNNQLGYAYQAVITTRNGSISEPGGRIYVRRLGGYRDGELGVENPPFPVLPPNGNNVILRAGRLVNIAKNAKGRDYIKNNDQDDLIAANINPRQTNYSDPSAKYKTFEHLTNLNSFAEGGTSNVQIMPGIYRKTDGTFGTFSGDGSYDILTSFKPATSDTRVVVCLWLDPSDGSLTATGSSEFSQNTDIKTDPATGLTYINECVASAPDGAIGLWSWIVNSDDTVISVTNKYRDLRGIVAGGGVSLDDLLDADITSASNRDVLYYDGTSWVNQALEADDIQSGQFGTNRIAPSAITTGKINNNAVTESKIGTNAVGPDQLQSTAITAGDYALPFVTFDADGRATDASDGLVTDTTDPGATDDSYDVGTLWINTNKGRTWQCVDNTNSAAVWQLIGGVYGVAASLSANQTITNSTNTIIAFDGSDYDPDSMLNTSTGVITIPRDGLWTVSTGVMFSNNSTGVRVAAAQINGTSVVTLRNDAVANTELTFTKIDLQLSSGDTVQTLAFQTSGATLNILGRDETFLTVRYTGEV